MLVVLSSQIKILFSSGGTFTKSATGSGKLAYLGAPSPNNPSPNSDPNAAPDLPITGSGKLSCRGVSQTVPCRLRLQHSLQAPPSCL
jgi:hypothetical protein